MVSHHFHPSGNHHSPKPFAAPSQVLRLPPPPAALTRSCAQEVRGPLRSTAGAVLLMGSLEGLEAAAMVKWMGFGW